MEHTELYAEIPIGSSVLARWNAAPVALLNSVATKIVAHGADPWAFAADARHFWQVATPEDVAVLSALTREEIDAVLGWDADDWAPYESVVR